jgi:hypothetical protein
MDMVQELRTKAYSRGNLSTTSQQKVIVVEKTIIIEPADPKVIYVPYYDPFSIYGPWWYPAYLPYYWGPPGVRTGIGISFRPGFFFGFSFGTWSYFDWHSRYIFINVQKRPRYVRNDRWISKPGRWNHASRHRRGVAYRDKSTARKFGQYPYPSRDFQRDIRGFPDLRERDLDRDRRVDDRIRIDRNKGGDDRSRIDLNRQKREQVDRDKKQRERVGRKSADRDKQQRERVERERKGRKSADRDKQIRGQAYRVLLGHDKHQQTDNNVFNRVEDGRRERKSSKRGRASRQGPDKDRGRNKR